MTDHREVHVGIGLHNKFHLELRDAITGELVQEGFAENVVLDQGIAKCVAWFGGTATGTVTSTGHFMCSAIGGLPAFGGAIALGSGNTAAAANQTALVTPVYAAASTFVSGTVAADNMTGNLVQRIVIDAGQRIGDVYKEVGLGSNDVVGTAISAGGLSTRALIKDGEGNPLTITKSDLEVLTVTSTVYAQVSHAYGPNLQMMSNANPNALMNALCLKSASQTGKWTNDAAGFHMGSNATILSVTDAAGSNVAVKTQVGSSVLPTVVTDVPNKRVTYSCRFPSTMAGTVREFGFSSHFGGGGSAWGNLFRLVLPIGDNSPTYDNVVAASSIAKDSSNVIDVSFVLQFGSL